MRKILVVCAMFMIGLGHAAAADLVRVGQGPFIANGAFYIARDKGYFKKVGIDVDARIYEDGALAVPSLIAKELDISNMPAAAGLFNSVAKGAPLVVILDQGQNKAGRSYTVVSVSNKLYDEGIHTLADFAKLKGRRFGVNSLGSINQYDLGRALQKAGLNPATDVTWVTNVPQPDLMKMLGLGQLDVAEYAYQFARVAEMNKLAHTIATGEDIEPDAQISTIVVRKDYLTANRDVVVRWAMAYLRAVKDFNEAAADPEHHADTVAILARNTVLNNPEIVKSIAPHWSYLDPDGLPNQKFIMGMQTFWRSGGFDFIQKPVSQEELIDLSVAQEARARLERDKPFD